MLGQVLDRYKLVERLGGGELGEVYKGQHPTLDHYRAVRVLPRRLSQDAALIARLLREVRRHAALNHPNIVRLEHVGEQAGQYYLVTDYVPGRSLRQLIEAHGSLSPERAIRVARQICAALAYAHEQGVLHGEVNPAEILVEENGHAKLADFGIARWRLACEPMGDPEYRSPEQIRGEDVDARSDLYSLGVALYEAVTGELPFTARSEKNVKRQHLQQAPVSPRFYSPEMPAALEQVILKSLAKRPRDRFASAEELEQALARVAGSIPHAAEPESDFTEAMQPAAAIAAEAVAAEPQPAEPAPPSPPCAEPEPRSDAAVTEGRRPSGPPAGLPAADSWLRMISDWSGQAPRGLPAAVREAIPTRSKEQKVALGAAAAVIAVSTVVLLLQSLGSAGASGRFTAESSVDPRTGREIGTVRAHSVPVFVITEPINGVLPGRRAEQAARRLERLLAGDPGRAMEPEQLDAVHNSAGELLLARRPGPGPGGDPRPEDVVVTVDASTASGYAETNRTSLALWWRDVLRDQIRLARGQPPMATRDTSYGRVLDRMQQQVHLKKRGGWVPAAELRRALNNLSAPQRETLNETWRTVPAAWRGGPSVASTHSAGPTALACENAFASDAAPGTSADALIDDDPSTVWQSRQGMKSRGERHWLKLALGEGVQVNRLEIREGSRGKPRQQLRIKQAKATFSDGSTQRLWRRKRTDPLRISLTPRVSRWVKLEVEQVFAHPRRNASRLCVSEVRLWGP